MKKQKPFIVKICLGSACYTRGSREVLEAIQAYIAEEKLESQVTLTGSLCEEQCRKGPTITINDVTYTGVDEKKALDLLDKHIHDLNDLDVTNFQTGGKSSDG
ncbi:MAG: (2Fe-2S) ferredoxin domain-containing protein [Desulfobacteraceae bacterium]|jgi:NADH:ubiquinone oxidoreductase subunit E